ncbi:integrase [Nonomuraea sp. NPDC004580]|uniref:integrase n=1 Tax=Nonomuraea sp. NPDC004580 TaxID=3154552 RepID=UPI0033A42289
MASVGKRVGRINEDFVGVLPEAAVLVDGAGIPGGEVTCRHGVAWYASHLGGTLLGLLPHHRDLADLLAEAITHVTDDHRDTCAVTDPISPSAAVAVLRLSGDRADYLVLGDATIVIDRSEEGAPVVVTDRREVVISGRYEAALKAADPGSDDYRRILGELRSHRNRPGGFWVAKDDPYAAREAIIGTVPGPASAAALLSNGASRIVDRFGLADWPELMAELARKGPADVIRRVREAEEREAVPPDDATIAHCTSLARPA